jgi:TPR repeat protein
MTRHHWIYATLLVAFITVMGGARAATSSVSSVGPSDPGRPDSDVLVRVGQQFTSGYPRDYSRAIALFRQAAEQGNADGALLLGRMYADGEGVPKDIGQAVTWYRMAAEEGNRYARSSLMSLFYFGQFDPVETSTGGPWWRNLVRQAEEEKQAYWRTFDAANRGDADAMIQLGFDYLMGVGVARNSLFAQAEFREAAEHQRVDAQCLFDIVSSEDGKPGETVQQCLNAATAGVAVSQLAVSYIYRNGRFGVHQNLQQMVYWESMAARQGMVEAETSLARDYDTGYGISKDEKQADVWYEKAVDQGSFVAMRALSTQAWEARNPLFAQYKFEDPIGDPLLEKKYEELSNEQGAIFIARNLMLSLFAPSEPRRWGLR